MKKSIIALMGLFTLVACSEDSYEQFDNENEPTKNSDTKYQTNSFNNDSLGNAHGDSGDSGVIWAGINYASPWDLWYRGVVRKQPAYLITNGTAENSSPYNLEVTAYVGLAYYDGINDGIFNDHKTGAIIPLANNLGGNYPNLYGGPAGTGQEAGKLVRVTNSFTVPAYPNPNSGIRIESANKHLAIQSGTPAHPGLPGEFEWYFFGNLTGPERTLLYDYGKVFFYEVVVTNKLTGTHVLTTLMHPEIKTLPTGPMPNSDWKKVQDLSGTHLKGTVPGLGNLNLYYYNANLPGGTQWNVNSKPYSSGKCDSREVVFEIPAGMNLHEVNLPGGKRLTLNFLQNNFWLWQNSALNLTMN